MSDDAILAKTGRTWAQWVKTLDELGARALSHTELAHTVASKFKLPGWWAQGVTVGYERMTGKRALHQSNGGFVANVSKTMTASAKKLFGILDDEKARKALLKKAVNFSTRTPAKTLRFAWTDTERVIIAFYEKAKDKAQIVVQHEKLAHADDVQKAKKFWQDVVARIEKIATR
ncbi:MAG: hypothetical protein JNM81_02625 [Rhodospirillaceae bacterium]|nr:hypothetical protein [Rhodospirillaceae bacterium]